MLSLAVLPILGPWLFLRTFLRSMLLEWRIKFLLPNVLPRHSELYELTTWVGRIFKHASPYMVSGVGYNVYKRVGYDFSQNYQGKGTICWEASVGFLVYLADRPSLGMGVELMGDTLTVRQLQGAKGLELNKSLQDWPRLFLMACVEFAIRREDISRVRVLRAHKLVFYKAPIVYPRKGQTYADVVEEHTRRMRRRYDGSARQLGFKITKNYYIWENPNYARPY